MRRAAGLDDLLAGSDVVSVHSRPATERAGSSARGNSRTKPTAYLVNTLPAGRGVNRSAGNAMVLYSDRNASTAACAVSRSGQAST